MGANGRPRHQTVRHCIPPAERIENTPIEIPDAGGRHVLHLSRRRQLTDDGNVEITGRDLREGSAERMAGPTGFERSWRALG